jgi:hypothetical protein
MKRFSRWMKQFSRWMKKIRRQHPRFWASLKTGVAAFFAVLTPTLFGYFAEVTRWANDARTDFPDPTGLGKAAIAALIAGLAGLYNFFWNQTKNNDITYTNPPKG